MDLRLLQEACDFFQTSTEVLSPLSGGHYNAVYRFPLPGTRRLSNESADQVYGILRVGVEDCPEEETLGMLEWVCFLSEHGAPVAAPVPSRQGKLLEKLEYAGKTYLITAFEEAQGTLAELISPGQWSDELFRSIGRAAGKLHAISRCYHPSKPSLIRPQWFYSNEIQDAKAWLTTNADPAGERLSELIQQLKLLPTDPASFGLIHDDLHFANFLIQSNGRVIIIDYDDCVYGWYSMDAAMALFDVLVLFNAPGERQRQDFAKHFMHHYLAGYRQEYELDPFWQQQIPNFLKLKEICVYVPLIGHADIHVPDSWVGRFMHGRAERIANRTPYVAIDFVRL